MLKAERQTMETELKQVREQNEESKRVIGEKENVIKKLEEQLDLLRNNSDASNG